MTWADVLSSGSGTVAWRVALDGFPFEAVSHKSMETTAADGRIRYNGLSSDGFKFSERLSSPPNAKTTAEGLTVKIVDTRKRWTLAFAKAPQQITWLTANEDNTATTIDVASTAMFPTPGMGELGYFYLNSETISYTGKTNTTFTGCSRGQFGSLAQYHYVTGGEHARNPEVTDVPRAIEGRRCRVYAYGPGDSLTGNGTVVWVGVVRGEPRFNGTSWTFSVDPLTSVLDVDIGTDLDSPRTPRGIYYPATAPLYMRIDERSGATLVSSEATYARIGFAGFYETQEAFCAALQTHIQNVLTSHAEGPVAFTQTNMRVVPDGASWRMEFTTDAASPRWMGVTMVSPTDGEIEPYLFEEDGSTADFGGVAGSTTYRIKLRPTAEVPNPGAVPRLAIGHHPSSYGATLPPDNMSGVDEATNPRGRVYIDAEPLSSVNRVLIEWPSGTDEPLALTLDVDAVSTSSRYLDLDTVGTPLAYYVATGDTLPTFRLARDIATGTIGDFLSGLASATSQYVNLGGQPFIRPTSGGVNGDFDIAGSELGHLATDPVCAHRTYSLLTSCSLREMVEEECRLAGVFLCYSSTGQLVLRRTRMPALSEVAGGTLDKHTIMVSDGLLTFEKAAFGLYNTVELLTGYDPAADEHKGTIRKVRDLSAYGANPIARVLTIAPKSTSTYEPTTADAVRIADRILGTYGAGYRVLKVGVSKTKFAQLLGDTVAVTWNKVPGLDGTLGVSSELGIIIGREWQIMASRGSFTILLPDGVRFAGYAPCAKVTSIAGTSGTTGPFTCSLSSDYFKSGDTAANHFSAGDLVRAIRWNSTTATEVLGTVDSVSGNDVVWTADSNWTHAAGAWALGYQRSTAISATGQKRYAFIAGSDRLLDWADETDVAPFTFS